MSPYRNVREMSPPKRRKDKFIWPEYRNRSKGLNLAFGNVDDDCLTLGSLLHTYKYFLSMKFIIAVKEFRIGFEVFTAVTMKTAVFWDVAPCRSCVNRLSSSAATCLHWFLARGFFYPEDGGDTFLRNVDSQILQFQVTLTTNYRVLTYSVNISYVVGRTIEAFLFQYIVSILWLLVILWCGYVKCTILRKADGLRLNICACCLLEMSFNISPTVLLVLENM
jgi:hypothetical protein